MKLFALLNNKNVVVNISVANDDWDTTGWLDCTDKDCAIGFIYNADLDVYIPPKPNCGHTELQLNDQYRWECSNADHETLA
jgi:hypothetical protein